MRRVLLLAAAILAASLLVTAAGEGAHAQGENPTLHARVGPGYTIGLTDESGERVTKLDPGTYDIEVEDQAIEHNFRLTGPGVTRQTPVEEMATQTWTVTFVDGVYTYFCVPHASQMRGTFTVGTPPSTTPPATNVVTPKSKLVLTSGPGYTITLKTGAGKTVKTMKTGTYSLTVRDRSSIHDAHVVAPGYNRQTTVPFVGTQTWKVPLKRVGVLRFYCDPHRAAGMRGSAKIVR